MNTVQKTVIVTVAAIEALRLGVQFLAPYRVLAGAVRCGPWIGSLVAKPALDPCRLAASGRVRAALIEAVMVLGLGFVLAVFAGARGPGGSSGDGGEPPPGDRPKDPAPSPAHAA
jgi:hypothetical protein